MTGRPAVETQLATAVAGAVLRLQEAYLKDESEAVRTLAVLRRDVNATSTESWDLLYHRLPEELYGRGDDPSRAEICFATALQLYALHQQGRTKPMHITGRSLGTAVQLLKDELDADSAVMRRFKTLGAASTWDGQRHHLRALVSRLRNAGEGGIGLDYARLCRDLYQLQHPQTADRVRQRWVRDVHRTARDTTAENATAPATEEETS